MKTYIAGCFAALALLCPGPIAEACSCAAQSPRKMVDGADAVYLARAGQSEVLIGGVDQPFEVLHTFKGAPAKTFVWSRREVNPLCGPEHQKGAVVLLFVTGKNLNLCSGNFSMGYHAPHFEKYMRASGQTTRKAGPSVVSAALSTQYQGKVARNGTKDVKVRKALLFGDFAYVSGRSGARFDVLLRKRKETPRWEVLYREYRK